MKFSVTNSYSEAYGLSAMHFEKEKNGDHFVLEEIKSEKILLALLCDGISCQPCDWPQNLHAIKSWKTFGHLIRLGYPTE